MKEFQQFYIQRNAEILRRWQAGESLRALAEEYGIARQSAAYARDKAERQSLKAAKKREQDRRLESLVLLVKEDLQRQRWPQDWTPERQYRQLQQERSKQQ